jgi:hypothetical protein
MLGIPSAWRSNAIPDPSARLRWEDLALTLLDRCTDHRRRLFQKPHPIVDSMKLASENEKVPAAAPRCAKHNEQFGMSQQELKRFQSF